MFALLISIMAMLNMNYEITGTNQVTVKNHPDDAIELTRSDAEFENLGGEDVFQGIVIIDETGE